MTDHNTKLAKLENALNDFRTSSAGIRGQIDAVMEECGNLTASITKRVATQAVYDELVNRPMRITVLPRTEHVKRIVTIGLVAAIGEFVGWDISDALELCGDIADDVNAHDESEEIRAMA